MWTRPLLLPSPGHRVVGLKRPLGPHGLHHGAEQGHLGQGLNAPAQALSWMAKWQEARWLPHHAEVLNQPASRLGSGCIFQAL